MNDSAHTLFSLFDTGKLTLPQQERHFDQLIWQPHPCFDGVELKHLITADDTDGQFSYHLVRISPNKTIGCHIHQPQLETHEVIAGSGYCINNGASLDYFAGVISIFPSGTEHEITAGCGGLYLFAKFIPALC